MKAAFYNGDQTITVGECTPVAPGKGEVQIKVSHCGLCGTDLHIYHGVMDQRVKMPQIMGHEMSGTIQAIGEGVEGWNVGDRVTVMPLDPCNDCPACEAGHTHICQNLKFLGIDTPGALQGMWTVPAHTLHKLPDNLSLAHGALIEPLSVACHDVRLGDVQPGEYVVVLGGGPIGMLVAMVAREKGAKILLSEINPFRLKLAEELGFETINPLEKDIEAYVNEQTGTAGADVVFEVTGSQAGASTMTKLARTRGRIVVVAIFGKAPQVDLKQMFWRELKIFGVRVYEDQDFEYAIQLAASGKLPLERIVTDIRPLDSLKTGFQTMEEGGPVMKILMEV